MSENKDFFEQRKHKRVSKVYDANYRFINGSMPSGLSDVLRESGHTKDISLAGVSVIGKIDGQADDIIRMELKLDKTESIVVYAEIKWVKTLIENNKIFGAEFITLKDEDIKKLEDALRTH